MIDHIVTIIGSSYFEPIALLYAQMENERFGAPSAIQACSRENGFAASICLLAVACLESYAMRVWYLHNPQADAPRDLRIVDYIPRLYGDFPFLEELAELYVQRDLLIHNHLWEIGFVYESGAKIVRGEVTRKSGGDRKYKRRASAEGEFTRRLRLNLNPIRVNHSDAKRVIGATWRVLQFLEYKDHNQCGVSHVPVKYMDQVHVVSDLLGAWRARWELRKLCG